MGGDGAGGTEKVGKEAGPYRQGIVARVARTNGGPSSKEERPAHPVVLRAGFPEDVMLLLQAHTSLENVSVGHASSEGRELTTSSGMARFIPALYIESLSI